MLSNQNMQVGNKEASDHKTHYAMFEGFVESSFHANKLEKKIPELDRYVICTTNWHID